MINTSDVESADRIYPVYKLVPLTASLAGAGIPAEQALAGSGITTAALGDPYARISRRQLIAVFDNFLRLAPDGLSPLRIGSSFHLTDYGFFGYALLSSETVRHAAHFAQRYRELGTPIVHLSLQENGDEAVWQIDSLPEIAANRPLSRFVQAYQSGIIVALHKGVSDNAFRLRSASFAFSAADAVADAAHYGSVFDCPVEFDAARTELRFDLAWLAQRPTGANAVTFRLVRDVCEEMLEKIGHARDTVSDICRRLLDQTGRFARLEEMAAMLGLHPRTLRRKLVSEGSTYQDIVDEVRFKLATTYLTRTAMSHESISERLGFSDASSFRRAFKRWTQLAPNAYREQHRAPGD